jgi:hypothetical protein
MHLAVGGESSLKIYDINDGHLIVTLSGHEAYIHDLFQMTDDSDDDSTLRICQQMQQNSLSTGIQVQFLA